MKEIEEFFVPFDIAEKVKELGYDETCLGYYENDNKKLIINHSNSPLFGKQLVKPDMYKNEYRNSELPEWATASPVYEQILSWLLFKYNIHVVIEPDKQMSNGHYVKIVHNSQVHSYDGLYQYNDAMEIGFKEAFKLII